MIYDVYRGDVFGPWLGTTTAESEQEALINAVNEYGTPVAVSYTPVEGN